MAHHITIHCLSTTLLAGECYDHAVAMHQEFLLVLLCECVELLQFNQLLFELPCILFVQGLVISLHFLLIETIVRFQSMHQEHLADFILSKFFLQTLRE